MDDDHDQSEPHFFDVLRQPVWAGDVCLAIGRAQKESERYDALTPILIKAIDPTSRDGHFAFRIVFKAADVESEFQIMIMKDEADSSDQFVKVHNPEFFVDSEPMAKILVKQSDLKNDLKR